MLEDERLVEIYIERTTNKSIVGNIYKGKVTRFCRNGGRFCRHRPRKGRVSLRQRRI